MDGLSHPFITGFATAMNIKPKWLRDICSVLFSLYYIFYANEAEEKVMSILPIFPILISQTAPSIPCHLYRRDAAGHLGEDREPHRKKSLYKPIKPSTNDLYSYGP